MFDKVLTILLDLGFKYCDDYEIVFTTGKDKVSYLQKELLFLKLETCLITLDKHQNKISFKDNNFRTLIIEYYLGEYYYPEIFKKLNEYFPHKMRKFKIKKIIESQ